MIAVKEMETPKACTSTQETLGDIGVVVVNCPLYSVCKHRDTIRTNYKPSDCPIVEIVTCKDCRFKHKTSDFHETEYRCRKYLQAEINGDFYCCGGRRE